MAANASATGEVGAVALMRRVQRYRSRKLHKALSTLDAFGIAHGETRDEVYATMRAHGWRWDSEVQRWRG